MACDADHERRAGFVGAPLQALGEPRGGYFAVSDLMSARIWAAVEPFGFSLR